MKNIASRLLWTLRYLMGWMPFFVLYLVAMAVNRHGSFGEALYQTTFYFAPGCLLGMVVWWFVGKVGERRHHWGKFFIIHLLGGLIYSAVWHGLFFGCLRLAAGPGVLRQFQFSQMFWMMLIGLLVYGVLAGMCSVSRLVKQVRERELNAAKAESLRVQAEMEVLRGQLDPHFLFNTLHSITALVREDPKRAEEALLQFGDLLRHVIATKRDGADEVPLGEELAFIDRYLALEKLRLGDRLNIQRDYSSEVQNCWLPTFSVQPLVENAIRHAIAPHRAGGLLKLSAHVREGRLIVIVEDSGPGAELSKVDKSSGVGLAAIRQRLKLRYGEAADFKIETAPGRGFRAMLSLPVVHNAIVDSVA
jgi:hypothetical protein